MNEGAGTRTRDQRIKSPLLYQLSYALESTGCARLHVQGEMVARNLANRIACLREILRSHKCVQKQSGPGEPGPRVNDSNETANQVMPLRRPKGVPSVPKAPGKARSKWAMYATIGVADLTVVLKN